MVTVRILGQIGSLSGIVTVPDTIASAWVKDGRAVPYDAPHQPVEETAAVAAPGGIRPRRTITTGEVR